MNRRRDRVKRSELKAAVRAYASGIVHGTMHLKDGVRWLMKEFSLREGQAEKRLKDRIKRLERAHGKPLI